MRMRKQYVWVVFACMLLLSGCARQNEPIQKTGLYFNTVIQVTLYDDTQLELLEQCFDMAEKYEHMLSRTWEGSDIWNMNHADGNEVEISEETGFLLEEALSYAKQTDGSVDPTVGAISSLWDFSSNEQKKVPAQADVKEALEKTGYDKIQLKKLPEGYLVTLEKGAQIDLGFIAKGYIADKMKEFLELNNVEHGLINLGGNILTIGAKPSGEGYSIGIKKPFGQQGETMTEVIVSDKSVVSSGIYERYFEKEGKLYHHILDMNTGYPVNNGLYHVTIVSKSSMQGDALSTACLVMGLDKGMELIENTEGCEALFMTDTYEIYKTSGWK